MLTSCLQFFCRLYQSMFLWLTDIASPHNPFFFFFSQKNDEENGTKGTRL